MTTAHPTDTVAGDRPGAVARRLYGALLAGDVEGAAQALAEDVVLHVPGSHPLGGDHRGPAGVLGWLAESRALTDDGEQIEVLDVLEGVELAAVYCRVTATRAGRAPLDNTTLHLLRVRDGRVAAVWLHNWDDLTVNDFWS